MLRPCLALSLVLALVGSGCAREVIGQPPPLDHPHYPVGLGLHPDGRWLAVASSNFDLEFSHGALLLADLDAVDAALTGASSDDPVVIPGGDVYVAGAQVPPFGNRPVFTFGGTSLLLPTRAQNRVVQVGLDLSDEDAPAFECAVSDENGTPRCTSAPGAAQLDGNDPFELVVFAGDEDDVSLRAAVAALGAPAILFVSVDQVVDQADSIVQQRSLDLEDLAPDGEVRGVHGLALRPAGGGLNSPRMFATLERTTSGLRGRAADLLWFDPGPGFRTQVSRLSLTAASGSLEARALAVAPGGDAVFVLVRDPDALLRVDLFTDGGAFSPHPAGVVSTCFAPTRLALASIAGPDGEPRERVLVTCYDNETVLAYDSVTLSETDAVRFFGRGPYDVLVDDARARAYVSFFQDDSIGVIDLKDEDGEVRMVVRGRVGEQRVELEDNR